MTNTKPVEKHGHGKTQKWRSWFLKQLSHRINQKDRKTLEQRKFSRVLD